MPDDPELENMNPILKVWMYENWLEDQNDDIELVKNHAYLVGSFINPEAVKQITGEGMTKHISSEDEYNASIRMVEEDREREKKEQPTKRRRRKLKG